VILAERFRNTTSESGLNGEKTIALSSMEEETDATGEKTP